MPCWRTPSTSSKPNAFEPVNVISLKYTGVSSHRAGSVHAELHQASARAAPSADLERLGRADRVVHHVDPAGERHRQPVGRLQHTARPRGDRLDELLAWLRRDRARAEMFGQAALRVETRHGHHLDVRVQRAQDRDARTSPARPRRRRAPCSRPRRVPGDPVQRHRERVGEHRLLVRDRVRDLEQHRVVRGHQLAEPTGHVLAHAGVDPGRDRPSRTTSTGSGRPPRRRGRSARCRAART